MPVGGSDNDLQGIKADVDKKDVSQRHSRLDPDVEAGHSEEVERDRPKCEKQKLTKINMLFKPSSYFSIKSRFSSIYYLNPV